eukprot:5030742-Prymnesium_polylepis.1
MTDAEIVAAAQAAEEAWAQEGAAAADEQAAEDSSMEVERCMLPVKAPVFTTSKKRKHKARTTSVQLNITSRHGGGSIHAKTAN